MMTEPPPAPLTDERIRECVQRYLANWSHEEGNLIMILHEMQDEHGYVPRPLAMELARVMGIKLARIYEVITFYHYFKLVPPGEHNIAVCMGTACYLKGTPGLLNELKKQLKLEEGGTTPDRKFHLEVVRCIGCCGMAPALVVDTRTYGKIGPGDIAGIIEETLNKEEEADS